MNFQSFDLNLLRVLDALLATNSTTHAGQRLGLSQPAVSSALSRLRQAMDDPLFVRQGRHLVPTETATRLHVPIRMLLEDAERLLNGAEEFDPDNAVQTFRLCGDDFVSELMLPRLAERLADRGRGIQMRLTACAPGRIESALEEASVDIALGPQQDHPAWLESAPLFRSRPVIVARHGHPVLSEAGIPPSARLPVDLFCRLTHVQFAPDGNLTDMIGPAFRRLGRARRVVMTMPVYSGVYTTVARSDHIALLPEHLAHRVAPRLDLVIYEPPVPIPPETICMIWHKRASQSAAHRWLRQQLSDVTRDLDRATRRPEGDAA